MKNVRLYVDTRSCPLDRIASIITIILEGHPGSWLLGGTLEIILGTLLTSESVVTPYLVQATSVCLHTHVEQRDVPAAGPLSHMINYLLLIDFNAPV